MRSKVLTLRGAANRFGCFLKMLEEDRVSLSAAQTSFFLITSAVPFLSLLITLTGHLLPEDVRAALFPSPPFSAALGELLRLIAEEISTAPSVSLLSLNAAATLWSASRGTAAVRSGLARIYDAELSANILTHRLKSLLSTAVMIVAIPSASLLFIFGDRLSALFGGVFSDISAHFGTPVFIALLAVAFTLIYFSVGRRSRSLPKHLPAHIPGALFSAAGWLVFSLFYSLYLRYFPRASAIYGSLAAVCLIMLWLYFCMIIFFLGAELNKHLFRFFGSRKEGAEG